MLDRQRIAGVIADSLDKNRTTGRSWSEWVAAADAVLGQLECVGHMDASGTVWMGKGEHDRLPVFAERTAAAAFIEGRAGCEGSRG